MGEGDRADAGTAPTSRRSWTDLGPRALSAIVLVAIAIGALYVGGYVFAAVAGAVFAGCYREWERMVTLQPLQPVGGLLIGLVAVAALAFPLAGPLATLGISAGAALVALAIERPVGYWRAGGLLFFGIVETALLMIRGTTHEGLLVSLFLAAVIWVTDTGAFFAGRQIGGERLAPDISPSKTWSGAIGGFGLGTLAGLVVWLIIAPATPWWVGLAIAASISVLGQLGDLSESAIKRRFRIKDSGDIIPGHGGLMDRLDSLTFGALLVCAIGIIRGGADAVAPGLLTW